MRKPLATAAIVLTLGSAGYATRSLTECRNAPDRFNCVQYVKNHDGDTANFNLPGVPELFGKNIAVRFLGIDTPEIITHDPCEKAAAEKAQKFVENKLKNAKRIDLIHAGKDKYFRVLADVQVDGESLTALLLKEGYGFPYDGGTKTKRNWCK
jgi:micrococcal nuclease